MSEPMTARKAEIVSVAGRLFAERGFEGASLRHIGDAVGMRRGSLYAHFESKEEIVELLLMPAIEQLRDVLTLSDADRSQPADEVLRAKIAEAIACCMANRDAILILFQDRRLLDESESLQHVSAEAKAITPLWLELIESAQEQGSVRADLDAATVAFGVYALLVASISKRHLGLEQAAGRPFEGDAVVDAAVTLLFDGITA